MRLYNTEIYGESTFKNTFTASLRIRKVRQKVY